MGEGEVGRNNKLYGIHKSFNDGMGREQVVCSEASLVGFVLDT